MYTEAGSSIEITLVSMYLLLIMAFLAALYCFSIAVKYVTVVLRTYFGYVLLHRPEHADP